MDGRDWDKMLFCWLSPCYSGCRRIRSGMSGLAFLHWSWVRWGESPGRRLKWSCSGKSSRRDVIFWWYIHMHSPLVCVAWSKLIAILSQGSRCDWLETKDWVRMVYSPPQDSLGVGKINNCKGSEHMRLSGWFGWATCSHFLQPPILRGGLLPEIRSSRQKESLVSFAAPSLLHNDSSSRKDVEVNSGKICDLVQDEWIGRKHTFQYTGKKFNQFSTTNW